jgi:hypothetical protein
VLIAVAATTLLIGMSSSACEKHLYGHQNSSDTNQEGGKK